MPHENIPDHLRTSAKRMRSAMTESERRLWQKLRAHRLGGLGFRRQMPVAGYIADFACTGFRLIVEVDGSHHALPEKSARDKIRTRKLGETGWTVIRFWNAEIMENLDGVCDHIAIWVEQQRRMK